MAPPLKHRLSITGYMCILAFIIAAGAEGSQADAELRTGQWTVFM